MRKEAKFWKSIQNKDVQCLLCAHNCKIKEGKRGVCGVRENDDGRLYTLIYGSYSSMAADPIEKKPLFHFYPGTNALSFGTAGCNFKCDHCQNYGISTARPEDIHMREMTPEDAVKLIKQYDCKGISWTYNEPAIWYEFTFDASKLAKKQGFYTCYVTNGYINEEPLREISPYLDAMNVDVKAFNDDFYKKICKAKLEPVKHTCELAKELDIHIEVTYLVIPEHNDSIEEIRSFCKWVVEKLGMETPVHFSRFHPDYKMTGVPATPFDKLKRSFEVAKESGILYPYMGNVPHGDYENTFCPKCGNTCIERYIFSGNVVGLTDSRCAKCGQKIPVVF